MDARRDHIDHIENIDHKLRSDLSGRRNGKRRGAALIMVLVVLTILLLVGAPFVSTMIVQDRESHHFSAAVKARLAAEGARNHAIARLHETVYAVEWEEEIANTEAVDTTGRRRRLAARSSSPRREEVRGNREGTRRDRRENSTRRQRSRRNRKAPTSNVPALPEYFRRSTAGPSAREFDDGDELVTALPAEGAAERSSQNAPGVSETDSPTGEYRTATANSHAGSASHLPLFGDGVTATVSVSDEQAKLNVNTAPPRAIASLLAVGELAEPLEPADTEIVLVDGRRFRSEPVRRGAPIRDEKVTGERQKTSARRARRLRSGLARIAGAVILVDPEVGLEAVTYQRRKGDVLADCFRHAFFTRATVTKKTFPAGTLVYDVRGWKLGYHRLWNEPLGGFQPARLTVFRSVEALREISNWQLASLFLGRFLDQGLSVEFLRKHGVSSAQLAATGLEPFLYSSDPPQPSREDRARLRIAERSLRRVRFSSDLVSKLRQQRGVAAVVELASRLEGATRTDVRREESEVKRSLGKTRRVVQFDGRYVSDVIDNLAEVYASPGVETLLAEDVERIRPHVTVSSTLPARWSEPQTVQNSGKKGAGRRNVRLPWGGEFNGATIVRISSRKDPDRFFFNEVSRGGVGGIRLAMPLRTRIEEFDTTVAALQRHPVNVNAAAPAVLRAVFTGVRGAGEDQVVTPYEADQLVRRVVESRPLTGHADFLELLEEAAADEIVSSDDVATLFANAVQPTHHILRASTVGLCYSTGDVYTIESRAVVRAAMGGRVGAAQFREIVEPSPPRRLSVGLDTQRDFADGIFLYDQAVGVRIGENHRTHLIGFPGVRSHLVQTRPLLLHRAPRSIPGGDRSGLRLFPASASLPRGEVVGDVLRFDDTHEGIELAHGESYLLDFSLGGGDDGELIDLTTIPAAVEFWFRLRTFPTARSPDGLLVLLQGGAVGDEGRNRMRLLFDPSRSLVLLRLWDATLFDPSIPNDDVLGQYLEIRAPRSIDLATWYHVRAVWDSVAPGGAQLFIDGVSSGTTNLTTRLARALALDGGGGGGAFTVEDGERLPREGVVRIGSELVEYRRSGNQFAVRVQPASSWRPPARKLREFREAGEVPTDDRDEDAVGAAKTRDALPGVAALGVAAAAAVTSPTQPMLMRGSANGRGTIGSEHPIGSQVALHGYSLPLAPLASLPSTQGVVPRLSANSIAVGRGGRRTADILPAYVIPQGDYDLSNLHISRADIPGEFYIVPLFWRDTVEVRAGVSSVAFPALKAADFFQSSGICAYGGFEFFYVKAAVPPTYIRELRNHPLAIDVDSGAIDGLKVVGVYTRDSASATSVDEARELLDEVQGVGFRLLYPLTQLSLAVDGPIAELYPQSGVLQVRGRPAEWDISGGAGPRPSLLGQSIFDHHPDDVVEWIRYTHVVDASVGGQPFHLFVAPPTSTSREGGRDLPFRGFESDPLQRRTLTLPIGEAVTQVLALDGAGAGYGDYVTLVGNDPTKVEPQTLRIHTVREHRSGLFFASLVAVDGSGREVSGSRASLRHTYRIEDEVRIEKFPSGRLPEHGVGKAVFFGGLDVAASRTSVTQDGAPAQQSEYRDETRGTVLDEIIRLRNSDAFTTLSGQRMSTSGFALVPLRDGNIILRQSGDRHHIAGTISADEEISVSNPLEVMLVGTESILFPFARGRQEGVLRVGDELFYFEADEAAELASATTNNPKPRSASRGEWRQPLLRQSGNERIQATVQRGFPRRGFASLSDGLGRSEVFYYGGRSSSGFRRVLRGQLGTSVLGRYGSLRQQHPIRGASRQVRLIGRGLLGTTRETHSVGDPVYSVPYLTGSPLAGPLTETGIPVTNSAVFRSPGYILVDSGRPSTPWEIIAHLGPFGEGMLRRPRSDDGRGILRAAFGTQPQPVGRGTFAWTLPYRHPDRYQPETASESLAYFQKTFRVSGARWRALEWTLRPWFGGRDRRVDVVALVRFDDESSWDAKPTNKPGGLYFFEVADRRRGADKPARFELDREADEVHVRFYFRYLSGAFSRTGETITDDWKETPVIERVNLEYEKGDVIVRHEELPF